MEAPTEPLLVRGDAVRLSEVLVNLLSNGVKFAPEGGSVSVRVETATGMILVHVSDTGIGIERDDLVRVFEPFSAVEKPT